MEDKRHFRELYVGCVCYCHDHVAHFMYFPKSELDGDDYEEELFVTVQKKNYYSFFKRLYLSFRLIIKKKGFLHESFPGIDFQNEDLEKISQFLSYFKRELNNDTQTPQPIAVRAIDGIRDQYVIDFYHMHYPEGDAYMGWSIDFNFHKTFWERFKVAFRYIFNMENGGAQFILNTYQIRDLRELVKYSLDKWKQSSK